MRENKINFDEYLVKIVAERLPPANNKKENLIVVRLPGGESLVIDPVDVLHALLKSKEVDELSNIDSDEIYSMGKKVKGELKGGKKGKRDKHFSIPQTDPFWEWWHRRHKEYCGGRDIESQEELDEHYSTYKNEVNRLFRHSFVRIAVNRLNSKKRNFAKRILKIYFQRFILEEVK